MKTKVTRTTIQQQLAAPIGAALQQAQEQLGLSGTDVDAQRRLFRALVTLAVGHLADKGAPPSVVLQQVLEATVTELKKRSEGAMEQGQVFGPQPPGQA